MTHAWRTLPSGAVEVDGAIPTMPAAELPTWRARVGRWRALAQAAAAKHGVPVHWLLGLITAESYGNPAVVSADGGHGLMQLTHPSVFAGHPPASTIGDAGAPLNIDLGARHVAKLARWAGVPRDLPAVASMYNAGQTASGPHAAAKSPWGMRETTGHIWRTVRAANTALADHVPPTAPPSGAGADDLRAGLLCVAIARAFAR